MLRTEKKDCVSELELIYRDSSSIIVTHYHSLTVGQITTLRKSLKEQGGEFRIIKNTLSKIAANNTGLDVLAGMCSGPTAIAYSKEVVEITKKIVAFSKANENLKIVGGVIEQQVVNEAEIRQFAKLPSLNELRSSIVGLLSAPASAIARVINTPAENLVRVIKAYSDKK